MAKSYGQDVGACRVDVAGRGEGAEQPVAGLHGEVMAARVELATLCD